MEERILEKLDCIGSRFDKMEAMIRKENAKLKKELKEELKKELKQELKEELKKELKEELGNEFRKENAKLKEELGNEFRKENAKLKEELGNEFRKENAKLKEELRNEFRRENAKLKEEVENDLGSKLQKYVRKEILDHMFMFEEEYGRKLTIAFEELTSRTSNEKIQDESIVNLKRTSELCTAYVYHHEDRIDKLERAQL